MFNSSNRTYSSHVQEVLREVKGGQHLRFINWLYRTKEVCAVAVLHDRSFHIRDLDCVPAGNLDYIENLLKEKNAYSLQMLEEEIGEKRKRIAEPGYFPDGITCWQDLLKENDASSYDDYLEKKFNAFTEEAKRTRETKEWQGSEEGKACLALQKLNIEVECSTGLSKIFSRYPKVLLNYSSKLLEEGLLNQHGETKSLEENQ